jgi:uncharacterized protein (DUF927 family)
MTDHMMLDPFAPLGLASLGGKTRSAPVSEDWIPELPALHEPPVAAAIMHPRLGAATARWVYRDGAGRPLFAAVRFDPPQGRKEVLPYTYGMLRGRRGWQFRSPQAPVPLYGLDRLAARLSAPVLLLEGEKTADAAAALFPGYVAMSWHGGAMALGKADFRPLAGRHVLVWPDNDVPGVEAATTAAARLRQAGAAQVGEVEVPAHWPEGWDVADPVPLGGDPNVLTAMLAAAERPCAIWPLGFSMHPAGLFWQPDDPEKPKQWLAGPFKVEGEVRGSDNGGWGLLLSWHDHDAHLHRWTVPQRALVGDPGALEAELMDRGLSIALTPALRAKLRVGLAGLRCEARVRSVTQTGWHQAPDGVVYVMAGGEAVGESAERVILLPEPATSCPAGGTLEGWREEVAGLALGNSCLAMFLAAAFAGPLLDVTGDKSGGFHLFGRSQSGKTTLLRCAASVWGAPDMGAALRSWRATANGLEGAAAETSDGLLALDELGQADGREVAEVVYLLGNESGKGRANRHGSARRARTWRLVFLSTGEMDLSAKLTEAGRRTMAGQDVRMASLPLPPDGPVSGNLHGRPDARALLEHLNAAVKRHYGTAARAFLAALARARTADAAGLKDAVEADRKHFVAAYLPSGADGQVASVARRFSLVAAAGELAAAFGVLPWPKGEATRAAGTCFAAWLKQRGGAGAAEDVEAITRVQHFVAAHGASRFEVLDMRGDAVETRIPNRAGWRRKDAEGRWEYLFEASVWQKEVCAGMDHRDVARSLKAAGLLRTEAEGRLTSKAPRIPGQGRPRVYLVTGGILEGEEH